MFSSLAGNDQVKRTLRRLIAEKRVPNSLLLAGPDGVGKRQFAIEIARATVCTDPRDGEGCGVCPACVRAGNFTFTTSEKGDDYERVFFSEHGDVGMIIPFRRNVRVGSVRALEREANFNPFEAEARFFIVDPADKMADAAANALLKTLEEPPPTSHIFLITSRPDSLLPTIRSRCQTLWFAPVETHEIEQYLINERAFTQHEAQLAAAASRGSIAAALSIDAEKYHERSERMLKIIGDASRGDLAMLLKASEAMNDAKNKEKFEDDIDMLESLLHDIWRSGISNDQKRIANAHHSDAIVRLASTMDRQSLVRWLAEIETMRQNFGVNINRKVASDAMMVVAVSN